MGLYAGDGHQAAIKELSGFYLGASQHLRLEGQLASDHRMLGTKTWGIVYAHGDSDRSPGKWVRLNFMSPA